MATLLLTSLATSVAGSFGFSAFATAALSAGAGLIGNFIDQKLFGQTVEIQQEGPRLDEVRFTGSSEGSPINRVTGRARIPGNIIWTTKYREEVITTTTSTGGGKGVGGGGATTTTTEYKYYVSFALAVCEGPIIQFGRIWTDGAVLDQKDYTIRPYLGTETQTKDPKIVAIEGTENVSAYRGIAYIVFEEMLLSDGFANRIPQLNVEVYKSPAAGRAEFEDRVKAITIIPASGEFAYGTTEVLTFDEGAGTSDTQNRHSFLEDTDFVASMDQLERLTPNLDNPSLVVAWHGTDLRVGTCDIEPRVEIDFKVEQPYTWEVSDLVRADATVVSYDEDDRPYVGGVVSDRAVKEAIEDLNSRGMNVTFYPFILMDIPPGNGLPDPYGGGEQGAFPWRGRITLANSADDKTAAARTQVNTFFGTAAVGDFGTWNGNTIPYTGPAEFKFRRMILHYAKLCAAAGGVDTFIIGTEMVELNRIRDNNGDHPAVDAFKTLAADVRSILGSGTTITYAADWSEFPNYRPDDGSGDVLFHLDPLWSDSNIDVIGMDNYMPLSDWRDDADHLDAQNYDSIYDKDYLKSQVAGGEGFDYFYASEADRFNQTRTTITDGTYQEPWVFKYKDLVSWWQNGHHNRPGGLKDNLTNLLPAAYTSVSGATLTVTGTPLAAFGTPVEVASAGQTADRCRTHTSNSIDNTGGRRFVFKAWVADGDSDNCRLIVAFSGGSPNCRYTFSTGGIITNDSGGLHTIHSFTAQDIGGGIFLFTMDVTLSNTDTTPQFEVGPFSATVGEYVTVYGAEVTEVGVSSTGWVPESKPIWFTEIGCPAVDKGTNQPNVFIDPKSSESFAPYFSSSDRDDFIQRQYNIVLIEYWADGANNPSSSVYSGTMVDDDRMYIWTWDARPFPEFPYRDSIWSDGENWETGHWLNGRLGSTPLNHYVDEITAPHPITIDATELYGMITGYTISDTLSPREIMQPLMRAYFFDAFESAGSIKFKHRGSTPLLALIEDDLVAEDSNKHGGPFNLVRGQLTETPREVRAKFVLDDYDYSTTSLSARRLIGSGTGVSESSYALIMSATQGQSMVDSQIIDAHVMRERIEMKLPPSLLRLDASDVISLNVNNRDFDFRLEELGYEYYRPTSGLRTEASTYKRSPGPSLRRNATSTIVVGLSTTVFMDLPLLRDTDVAHAPWFASAASPWPGPIAIFRSSTGTTFTEDNGPTVPSVLGSTLSDLPTGPANTWDRGTTLEVAVNSFGTLSSLDELDVLAGGNRAAIYNSTADEWEIIQWASAVPGASANTYILTQLLRGQLGTEHAMASPLATGARFVVLDLPIVQSNMGIGLRGLDLEWQYGPAKDPIGDPTYTTIQFTPEGKGLRPYSPCSVRATKDAASNDITLSWLRRTRIGGETWDNSDVPLSEDFERYEIDIFNGAGDTVLRTITVDDATTQTYSSADQTTDFGSSPTTLDFEVFQISGTFGRGIGRREQVTFRF